MKIKLIRPHIESPESNLRVYNLEDHQYYLVAVLKKDSQWPLVTRVYDGKKYINYVGKILANQPSHIETNMDTILFKVSKEIAHSFTWFFVREYGRGMGLDKTESPKQHNYRQRIIERLALEIHNAYENTTKNS